VSVSERERVCVYVCVCMCVRVSNKGGRIEITNIGEACDAKQLGWHEGGFFYLFILEDPS